MAHLAAAWPDQVLCKENKRKALAEQHRRWLEERERDMARQQSTHLQQPPHTVPVPEEDDSESLEDINGFLADVGRAIDDAYTRPLHPSYEETNAMLRNLHLERQGTTNRVPPGEGTTALADRGVERQGPEKVLGPRIDAALLPLTPAEVGTLAPPGRSQRRSAAQRAAAERLGQPRQQHAEHRAPARSLIGSEDFYRHKQEAIGHYRQVYNTRVGHHFDALAAGTGVATALPAPPPADAIGALAHETASRHVAPIRQLVRSSGSDITGSSDGAAGSLRWRPHDSATTAPSSGSMVGFTSGKTAGRRGGRSGRSGSVHEALQAAKSRGPML